MSDASNPVRDSSRMTVEAALAQSSALRRQDMTMLSELAKDSPRLAVETLERRVGSKPGDATPIVERMTRPLPSPPLTDEMLTEALDVYKSHMPVCGLVAEDGRPWHPPGVNQAGGAVSVQRSFGNSGCDRYQIAHALDYLSPGEVEEAVGSWMYTAGTTTGFARRLREQLTRKCVSVLYNPHTRKAETKASLFALYRKVLPVDLSRLPDWRRDVLDSLKELTLSTKSSTGAPFWQPKRDALGRVLSEGIPQVVQSIKDGTMDQLFKSQPELFLVEVKNKTDRYESPDEKTRPYANFPDCLSLLASVLCQGFCRALKLFTEEGHNAYGFSAAHGGLSKARDKALALKNGEMTFWCYGDDVDMYHRDRRGVLWRLCPDFRQMDGSIDGDLMETVIDWVVREYSLAYPDSPEIDFWRAVAHEWKLMCTDPLLVVHGKTIFKKKSKNGLLSGAPGTTLFDTVKSAVSYSRYHEAVMYDPSLIEDEKRSIAFFQSMGLEVKKGTWTRVPVNESPVPGDLWTNQKFLGVRWRYRQGIQKVELVPDLPEEDWIRNLIVARSDPKMGQHEQKMDWRTRFDRLRGLMITGGFSNERFRRLLNSLMLAVPGHAILMSVQADGGRGEQPEFQAVSGEDFHWPTSEGWPTVKWCENLYFSPDNQWTDKEGGPLSFSPVFPELDDWVKEYRKVDRRLANLSVCDMAKGNPFRAGPSEVLATAVVNDADSFFPEKPGHIIIDMPPDALDMELPCPATGDARTVSDYKIKYSVRPDGKAPTIRELLLRAMGTTSSRFDKLSTRIDPEEWECAWALIRDCDEMHWSYAVDRTSSVWLSMVFKLCPEALDMADAGKALHYVVQTLGHLEMYSTPLLTDWQIARHFGIHPTRVRVEAESAGLYVQRIKGEVYIGEVRVDGAPIINRQDPGLVPEVLGREAPANTAVLARAQQELPRMPLESDLIYPPYWTHVPQKVGLTPGEYLQEAFAQNKCCLEAKTMEDGTVQLQAVKSLPPLTPGGPNEYDKFVMARIPGPKGPAKAKFAQHLAQNTYAKTLLMYSGPKKVQTESLHVVEHRGKPLYVTYKGNAYIGRQAPQNWEYGIEDDKTIVRVQHGGQKITLPKQRSRMLPGVERVFAGGVVDLTTLHLPIPKIDSLLKNECRPYTEKQPEPQQAGSSSTPRKKTWAEEVEEATTSGVSSDSSSSGSGRGGTPSRRDPNATSSRRSNEDLRVRRGSGTAGANNYRTQDPRHAQPKSLVVDKHKGTGSSRSLDQVATSSDESGGSTTQSSHTGGWIRVGVDRGSRRGKGGRKSGPATGPVRTPQQDGQHVAKGRNSHSNREPCPEVALPQRRGPAGHGARPSARASRV